MEVAKGLMYSRSDKHGSMHVWDHWGFARKLHVRALLHVKGDNVDVVTNNLSRCMVQGSIKI